MHPGENMRLEKFSYMACLGWVLIKNLQFELKRLFQMDNPIQRDGSYRTKYWKKFPWCAEKWRKTWKNVANFGSRFWNFPGFRDGEHHCLVCDYSTWKKANLLVHMRKHNPLPEMSQPPAAGVSHTTRILCGFARTRFLGASSPLTSGYFSEWVSQWGSQSMSQQLLTLSKEFHFCGIIQLV